MMLEPRITLASLKSLATRRSLTDLEEAGSAPARDMTSKGMMVMLRNGRCTGSAGVSGSSGQRWSMRAHNAAWERRTLPIRPRERISRSTLCAHVQEEPALQVSLGQCHMPALVRPLARGDGEDKVHNDVQCEY